MNDERMSYRGGRRGWPPFHDDADPGHRGRRPFLFDRPSRGRMRRGDVRSALLIALLDGPGHGYELIQVLEAKTGGRWKPSPGSVYPSLQLLADEGLVTSTERDGKRVFELTDEGRAQAEERVAEEGYPWDEMDRGLGGVGQLRLAMRDLHLAAKQFGPTASPEAVERATEILMQARRDLYRLLAEA
jgi:DNA-binding PadR family transcriptional regulator